jgi:SAM-dependent methyltransferase
MKISENILKILSECEIENNTLFLPPEQLDRKTYLAVNKCLENIGGKWNRKTKGHVFDYDPTEAFENLIMTGETEDMKKNFQFFPTPRPIAETVCDMAELSTAANILEPSCGKGDLADVIYERNQNLSCIEINWDMKKYLDEKPYPCMVGNDFLQYLSETIREFDRIVMNPPFSRQQDIDHIRHAYRLLKKGGILVSIVSVSPFFRVNKKSVEFREWLKNQKAEIVDIEGGAFKESGTPIPVKIIKLKKRYA